MRSNRKADPVAKYATYEGFNTSFRNSRDATGPS